MRNELVYVLIAELTTSGQRGTVRLGPSFFKISCMNPKGLRSDRVRVTLSVPFCTPDLWLKATET